MENVAARQLRHLLAIIILEAVHAHGAVVVELLFVIGAHAVVGDGPLEAISETVELALLVLELLHEHHEHDVRHGDHAQAEQRLQNLYQAQNEEDAHENECDTRVRLLLAIIRSREVHEVSINDVGGDAKHVDEDEN